VVPRKRIDLLLDVFAAARTRHTRARLVRVGGPLTGAQQRQARALGVADHIVTLPFIDRRVLAAVYPPRGARAAALGSRRVRLPVARRWRAARRWWPACCRR
jgi:glycosyltransferase involved in cell wall biosynthesis